MNLEAPTPTPRHGTSREPFLVFWAIVALIVLSAALALRTVADPASLEVASKNPTPYGYTWSLLLFLVPLTALAWWFGRQPKRSLPKRAFWRTILVLAPAGFVLDLLFGHAFFEFPNHGATLGLDLPAVGGPIPIEEFVFYLGGFMVVLLSYIWADEYWLGAYNVPDYAAAAQGMKRLARFHPWSIALGAALPAAALAYKKLISAAPEGFPWYFTYLVLVAVVPATGFFPATQPFINWRAFGFTFFFMLPISLLWEVTLAVPYGWWGYEPRAMIGLTIGAWWNLPIEAVCVWLSVTFTTVITYEVIKIWQALGTGAVQTFFGGRPVVPGLRLRD